MTIPLPDFLQQCRDCLVSMQETGWTLINNQHVIEVLLDSHHVISAAPDTPLFIHSDKLLQQFIHWNINAPEHAQWLTGMTAFSHFVDGLAALVKFEATALAWLPTHPERYVFLFITDEPTWMHTWQQVLISVGFRVQEVARADQTSLQQARQLALTDTIEQLICVVSAQDEALLSAHSKGQFFDVPSGSKKPPVWLGILDTEDFFSQRKLLQLGITSLFLTDTECAHVITALAGVAWQPRNLFRVLCVATDAHVEALFDGQVACFYPTDFFDLESNIEAFAPEVGLINVTSEYADALSMATWLHKHPAYAGLPLIFSIEANDYALQRIVRELGASDCLLHPVKPAVMLASVATLARKQRVQKLPSAPTSSLALAALRSQYSPTALVLISTFEGSIIDSSPALADVLGYSQTECLALSLHDENTTKAFIHWPSKAWQALQQGQTWTGKLKSRHKTGHSVWLNAIILPILGATGVPESLLMIASDYTQEYQQHLHNQRRLTLNQHCHNALEAFLLRHDLSSSSAMILKGLLSCTKSNIGFFGWVEMDAHGAPVFKPIVVVNAMIAPQDTLLATQLSQLMTHIMSEVLSTGEHIINNNALSLQPLAIPDIALTSLIGYGLFNDKKMLGMLGMLNSADGYDHSSIQLLTSYANIFLGLLIATPKLNSPELNIIPVDIAKQDVQLQHWQSFENKACSSLNAIFGHSQIMQMNEHLDALQREQLEEINKGGELLLSLIHQLPAQLGLPSKGRSIELGIAQTKAPAQSMRAQSLVPNAAVKQKILVAEDSHASQLLLIMQLELLGHEVDVAADGAAALSLWQSQSYTMLLCDLHMLELNGLELTQCIREQEQGSGRHLPIIGITADKYPSEWARCKEAGMDDVLLKPVQLTTLTEKLVRWLPALETPVAAIQTAALPEPKAYSSILDLTYLNELMGHYSADQFYDLVSVFINSVKDDLPVYRQHLKQGHPEAIASLMHKHKSSAKTVGALDFASLVEVIEAATLNNDLSIASDYYPKLEHALSAVELAAHALLQSSNTPFPDEPTAIPINPKYPQHILVVDDDPTTLRHMNILLNELGVAQVSVLDNPEEVLEKLMEFSGFDVLITDLKMPTMDGIEFLRHLAENNFNRSIILMSSVEESLLHITADMLSDKGLNILGTLKKPVSHEALKTLLVQQSSSVGLDKQRIKKDALSILPEAILAGVRDDEFEVYFQPKVDALSLKVVGLEALARWHHQGKFIPPDIFIITAEQHGLIKELSELLFKKALLGGVELTNAGYSLAIAINISANWLSDIYLPEFILSSVEATGFNYKNLTLEITETGVMADMATALDVMTRLRLKGFKLSIDDFGTGYSSLEHLRRIPFNELKIDRSFVRGAAEKPAMRTILESTLAMAKKLNLATVAEGVETQEDLDLVRSLGCDQVQGWLIARAMPLPDLLVWLKARDEN